MQGGVPLHARKIELLCELAKLSQVGKRIVWTMDRTEVPRAAIDIEDAIDGCDKSVESCIRYEIAQSSPEAVVVRPGNERRRHFRLTIQRYQGDGRKRDVEILRDAGPSRLFWSTTRKSSRAFLITSRRELADDSLPSWRHS